MGNKFHLICFCEEFYNCNAKSGLVNQVLVHKEDPMVFFSPSLPVISLGKGEVGMYGGMK